MTKVGLVGCGHWGKLIARDLKVLGCDVTAVARSADSKQRARDAGASVVESIDSLAPQDAYVIASPTSLHVQHIRALLVRERPIFCEKPLGMSSRELGALPSTARDFVFSMDKWRYHPGILWLADCARAQRLGAVQGLSLVRVGGVSSQSSVTAVWHLAPHDLSIVLEILGSIPEVRASALASIGDWTYQANVTLGSSPWVTINISERRAAHYREVRLFCEHGEATLSGAYADTIVVRRHTAKKLGEPELMPIDNAMPLLAELRTFLDFVRGSGVRPKSSLTEATLVVQRIEEIHALGGRNADALIPLPGA